jgi:uncharacterized repeat protein (TIGR02543 family)
MRSLAFVFVAACGGGHQPPAGSVDSGPTASVAIRGSCAYPLGPSGELVFPDNAAGAQTAYRPLDVINTGPQLIGRENLQWVFEGADAAEFAVVGGLQQEDQEACTFHEMDTVIFGPGSSCRLDVLFHPTTPGPKQATLHVTYYNGIDQTFTVRGSAVAAPTGLYASTPDLYVRPQTITNGQSFMLVNAGTSSIDLGQPAITGPFAINPGWNCPSPLTTGAACMVGTFFNASATASGCPMGTFTTSTGAITVPLTARYVPTVVRVDAASYGSTRIDPPGQICTTTSIPDCQAIFDVPTAVTLTATPDSGGHFIGWYAQPASACGIDPVCSLPAGSAGVYVAPRFASAQAKAIAVTITGTGTVDGGYSGSCSASCTLYTEPGGQVTLTESTTGTFTGWSGDCTGTQTTCNLGNVINDRVVTATFTP